MTYMIVCTLTRALASWHDSPLDEVELCM